jgi:hypothetical protein
MDAKRLQANWEHLQAREAEIKAKDEEYRKMVGECVGKRVPVLRNT